MDLLPSDMIIEIFRQFHPEYVRQVIRRVCKKFDRYFQRKEYYSMEEYNIYLRKSGINEYINVPADVFTSDLDSAIKYCDIRMLEKFVKRKETSWKELSTNHKLMHSSIKYGDVGKVKYLISKGSKYLSSCVNVAAQSNKFGCLEYFHGMGYKVDKYTHCHAIYGNAIDALRYLVSVGCPESSTGYDLYDPKKNIHKEWSPTNKVKLAQVFTKKNYLELMEELIHVPDINILELLSISASRKYPGMFRLIYEEYKNRNPNIDEVVGEITLELVKNKEWEKARYMINNIISRYPTQKEICEAIIKETVEDNPSL